MIKTFKNLFLFSFLLLSAGIMIPSGISQTSPPFQPEGEMEISEMPVVTPPLQAQMTLPESAEMKKNVIFDAGKTYNPLEQTAPTQYKWDFGDGKSAEGKEVIHSYDQTGKYKVTLEVNNGQEISRNEQEIFIYRKLIILVTDKTSKKSQIDALIEYGKTEGVYVKVIDAYDRVSEFISEEILTKKISESIPTLKEAQEIIIWTDGNSGLNAFNRLANETDLKTSDFESKVFLIVVDQIDNIRINPKLNFFNPEKIFVANESSIYPFIQSKDNNLVLLLQKGGYEYRLIDESSRELHIWNFMTYFVNILIESGIPENTILLILMLPVIATVIVIVRQVIGLVTHGMYTPAIIALIFLVLGIKFGLITLFLSLGVGAITRYLLKYARILYIPKLSIVLTVISLSIFGFLSLGTSFKIFESQFSSLAIFPMLILGTLTEKFISVQNEQSFWSALKLTIQTIFVAILAYTIVGGEMNLGFINFKFDTIQNLLRNVPEIIFLFLLANIALGKWTGLRLVEYIRFREILRHNEEE